MAVTTGDIPRLLEEGLNDIYGQNLKRFPNQWKSLYELNNTKKNMERDQSVISLGVMAVNSEGAGVTFDEWKQGYNYDYIMLKYSLAVEFTEESIEDNLYMSQLESAGEMLAKSESETREIIAHNILNRAFNSTYTYGDGKELLATDHPFVSGGTWSNELATPANFNEASAEQSVIDMGAYTDDRGKRQLVKPLSLHVPTAIEFDAERFINSTLRPGTADNDLNAIKSLNKFPGGVFVHNYLTSATAWFIKTDAIKGLRYFNRKSSKLVSDNVFITGNVRFKLVARFAFGVSDVHQMFGSPGA